MKNEKKIAFIVCVNDSEYYEECASYLDKLELPEGYEKDILAVQDAPGMTAGYQAAMMDSDAKYKVYLHQDVFIFNKQFIRDILEIFTSDDRIGLIGCVGATDLESHARAITNWDTGKVWHNCTPHLLSYDMDTEWKEVEAVDGFLMATQYDLSWREDLFDGWDYYDISQCMEMKRKGYLCVVPDQKEPWCYHDNAYSKLTRYFDYTTRFVNEYQDIKKFQLLPVSDEMREWMKAQENTRNAIQMMVEFGERKELLELFGKPENRGFLYLREYQTIADIEKAEEMYQVPAEQHLWRIQDGEKDVITRLRQLRHRLIRYQFQQEDKRSGFEQIKNLYSEYAVKVTEDSYGVGRSGE